MIFICGQVISAEEYLKAKTNPITAEKSRLKAAVKEKLNDEKIILVAMLLVGLFLVRFVFAGPEDNWVCKNGQWVKHGQPSSPMPQDTCPS